MGEGGRAGRGEGRGGGEEVKGEGRGGGEEVRGRGIKVYGNSRDGGVG